MTHPFTSRVSVAPSVLFQVVGEEAVMLNLKTELFLGLDAMGTRMWTLLTESPSIQLAYNSLLGEYDVEPARLQRELNEFINKLLEQSLIELDPGELSPSVLPQ
ncbi:MAG: hypothetical protein AUI36_41315 [Cyanobacteria bacterium 13_1_40CM_2_61_4]|nr:MAG: hypothetical protein AUI36_41315 [Cyanobacteria bacterium 13_1_40CM_2_61_4]